MPVPSQFFLIACSSSLHFEIARTSLASHSTRPPRAELNLQAHHRLPTLPRRQSLIASAQTSLPASRVDAFHQLPLQTFDPPMGRAYAVVWVQWVLNYLTDADLIAFLRRVAAALDGPGEF